MAKVIFVNEYGTSEVRDMDYIPRIGDTVPIMGYRPKVGGVSWFPDVLDPKLKGMDVLITLI